MELAGGLADRDAWSPVGHCPVESAAGLIGNRTALLILREAYYGTTRFEDFCQRVGMSRSAASQRLRELQEAGLLTTRTYQDEGRRQREEYVLTESGLELEPVVVGIFTWSRRHLRPDAQVSVEHHGCGGEVAPVLMCEHGHRVDDGDIELRYRRA